jgi:predicted DNA-binding transcriptional regulator YafY
MAQRAVQPKHFQRVGTALLRRKRLRIVYQARGTGNVTEREVSPLRLVHYRDNWHLDAWCHLRKALRNFAVDAIQEAEMLNTPSKEVNDAKLDATFGPSYGIFAGNRVRWARWRFTPERARWVANEEWHPQQRGRWDEQGHWLLDVPYADLRELVKDILQHMPDVEVLGPPGLRQEVRQRMEQGLQRPGAAG